MTAPPFAHLQVRSHYSLMRGTASIDALLIAARDRGMRSMALTDIDGVYGAVRFLEMARTIGLRPILGATITPVVGPGRAATSKTAAGSGKAGAEGRATLLIRDAAGWSALCRLLTRRHLEPAFDLVPALVEGCEGLVVLSASLPLLRALHAARGPRDLYLALEPAGAAAYGATRGGVLAALREARRLGIEPVAVNDVHFLDPRDFEHHRMLRAIALNTTRDRVPTDELAPPSAWLKPAAEMERLVPHCPESLATAGRLAGECGLDAPPWSGLVVPRAADLGASLSGGEAALRAARADAFALLEARCDEGARRRYGAVTPAVRARLDHELAIIRDKDFADYFLVVQEIVRQSPRTCGRGSAAASIVSYCLGITHVEPLRHDLYFERFLNRGRVDPPDIDVDFCWDERDGVIDWVVRAFGERRVAMIANHVTFRARAAVREVAKVYGLPDGEIKRVTDRLAHDWHAGSAAEAMAASPLFNDDALRAGPGGLLSRPPWPEVLERSAALENAPRHLSVHCGGVVIAPDGVDAHVPVERAAKGVRVIQWEKDQAEDAGLVKIDLLGNRSLAVIRDACRALRAGGGPDIPDDDFDPLDDPRTQELLRDGDTMGVFYVESPAMRQLQQKTRRGDFEHLVIHSSIIRPAANDYIREYVRRLRGGTWSTLHPILDEVLRDSYGIMCYQEDVARVAIRMAGFSDAEADGLRKVLSKKWAGHRVEEFRRRFREGALARGIDAAIVEEVWKMILSFSGYSFCKPHSASYALVSFRSAWLKAHHPAEFMAAVIANGGGYYSAFAYVSECRRMGLTVLPPDVNVSARGWTGQSAGAGSAAGVSGGRPGATGPRGWVRAGLAAIKGLRETAIDRLVAERDRRGGYRSLDDLLMRTGIDPSDARRLVRAGACDSLTEGASGRPRLHWRLRDWEARSSAARRAGTASLFAPAPAAPARPRPPSEDQMLRDEEETLGYLLSRHPLTLYRSALATLRREGTLLVRGADMGRHVGRRVTMIGWLVTGKLVSTKDDEPMEFVSFEDTTAIYETTFFPEAYARFCRMLTTARPYVLKGKVDEEFGAVSLTVDSAAFLDQARAPERAPARAPISGDAAAAAARPGAARPGSPRRTSSGRSAPRPGPPDPPA